MSRLALAGLCFIFILSACVNGGNRSKTSQTSIAESVGGNNLITINQVLRTTSNPSGSFDVIGDGSGAIAQYCTSAQNSDQGPTNCKCSYTFARSDGTVQTIENDTTYHETNLVRCSSQGVQVGTTNINFKLTIASGGSSNELVITPQGLAVSLDLTNPINYAKADRYQCRDAIFIPHIFDSKIYDPFLSDDPELSYPLNFYTTNKGGTISAFVANPGAAPSNGSGWICPLSPSLGKAPGTLVDDITSLDLRIFSVASETGGDNKIYPPTAGVGTDRSTFFLARQPAGLFTVPVNAYIAPNTVTAPGTSGTPPPLGYGVAPIPIGNSGSGMERCPLQSELAIPARTRWVKVWLFRASLAARFYPSSNALQKTAQGLFCNPGTYQGSTKVVFSDCGNAGRTIPTSAPNATIADRVILGSQACVTPSIGAGSGLWIGSSQTAGGTDRWSLVNGAQPAFACSGQVPDPFNLCNSSNRVPFDGTLTSNSIDANNTSRYDFLFVVTPAADASNNPLNPPVNTVNFKNADQVAAQYTPYRFYSPKFCPDGADPTDPSQCAQNEIVNYGFKAFDVGTNGDAPPGQAGRQPVFPVCALQTY